MELENIPDKHCVCVCGGGQGAASGWQRIDLMTAEDKDVVTIQLFVRNKKTKKLNPCLLKEITVLHTIAKRKDGVNEFDKL